MVTMLTKSDIEHLCVLARIAVSPDEQEKIAHDLDSVLAYVSEVAAVTTEEDAIPRVGELRNVMRADECAYPGGEFTDMIIKNAPDTEGGYVKVKQIL